MAATRRLAAVMFTDIVGYTSLSQRDEGAALRLLQEQDELLGPIFTNHHGQRIKSVGDGLLVEFDSAREAVQCAVDIQQLLHQRNDRGGGTPFHVRIGIHLGDVEKRGSDIFGDAVNIASRIEPFADPGGICLSRQVYDQVQNKLVFRLEKLAPRDLKGIRGPIDLYRVVLPWWTPVSEPPRPGPTRLAVLPLTNISPDPKDEYFSDGLTEELITILSRLRELLVIARTSVVQYKSTSKSVEQIGAELGVTAILEGSVRKAGDALRITVQLIDVASQGHIWADTYDRKLDDIFAVQTDVARKVAEALKLKVVRTEEARLESRPLVHPDSYLAYLRGRYLLSSRWSEETFRSAKQQFEEALAIDPSNARAYSGLSDAIRWLGENYLEGNREGWEAPSRANAARAIDLDPSLAEAHCSLGALLWDDFDYAAAQRELNAAVALNPSYSQAHFLRAGLLEDLGETDEALREFALAEQCDPHSSVILEPFVMLLIMLRRLEEAKLKLERLRELDRGGPTYYGLLSWYYFAGSDFARAVQAAEREENLAPGESGSGIVWAYAASGERERARRSLEDRRGRAKRPPAWSLATCYALLGDLEETFRLLEKAREDHVLPLQVWRNEPALGPARRDARFAQLLKELNLSG